MSSTDSDKCKTASSALAVLNSGNGKHFIFEDLTFIGRSPTASICITDQHISRNHCVIEKTKDNKFTICDLSNSGTFVNQRKLIQNVPQELEHRDWINLAGIDKYTYKFVMNLHLSGKTAYKRKLRLASPLSVKMNDLNESQSMEKERMDNELTLVEAEMCRLKEELQQQLKAREDELEQERLKMSAECIFNKELAYKEELKFKEMLEEKSKTLSEHENKITEVTKKLEELQKNKNEMEGRHQIEREEMENRCKSEIEELKKKLENSETKNQQFEELQAQLEETKCILLESELEQQRLFEAKVDVETKLETKIIDLTNEREEQVKELKKKLKQKEEREERVKKDIEGLEEDMMCSICAEIYIEPTALNCGHMFCSLCIKEWNKKKKICPMCRAKITTTIRIFNMDSVIEKNIRLMSEEARTHREAVIAERKKDKTCQKNRPPKKRRRENLPQAPLRLEIRNIVDPDMDHGFEFLHQTRREGDDDPFQMGWVQHRNHRPVRRQSPVPVAAVDLTTYGADYEPRASRARTHTVTSADANSTIDLTNL